MEACATRIALADEHRVLTDSLAFRLGREPDVQVVGTAAHAKEALALILETKPDLAMLGLNLPGRGPFEIALEVAERQGETNIVFLAGFHSDALIAQTLQVHARGYLLKCEPVGVVIEGIKRVQAGEVCFSAAVESRLRRDPLTTCYQLCSQCGLSSLSSRQLEVFRHLANGLSVKEVARTMGLSRKSVDCHNYRIMKKLGIRDRAQLVRYAIRECVIEA